MNPHPQGRRWKTVFKSRSSRLIALLFIISSVTSNFAARAEAAPVRTENYIVRLKASVNPSSFIVAQIKKGVKPTELYTSVFPGFQSRLSPSAYQRLKKDSKVVSISKVQTFSIPRKPIVRGVGYVWGLDRIDQKTLPLNNLYSPKTSGSGVSAFVIDTGVDGSHPEFGGRVATGYSAITGRGGNTDCHGHGTHVAGTVAGTNVGVANRATVVPIQVLSCSGQGSTGQILRGIDYVIGLHRNGEPAVANLSLGGGVDAALDAGIRAMVADGITVVVAAGNSNADACRTSPAREPLAITVGATSQSDTRASFSNYGGCLDIFAPGVEILSSFPSNRYAQLNGTSMAAPHVAGVAALILEANPGFSSSQITSALIGGSTPNQVISAGTRSPNRMLYSNVESSTPPPTTTIPSPPTTTPIAPVQPGSVNALRALASSTSIVAIWSAPTTGGVPTNYDIDYKKTTESGWTSAVSTSAASTSATINSLTSGIYVVRVAARNSVGRSQYVESSQVTISDTAPTVTLSSATFKDPWSRATVSSVRLDSSGGQVSLDVELRASSGLPNATDQVWGQLCPAGATYPDVNRCTGSLFPGQSSTGTVGTYGGLFVVSSAVQTGTWYASIEVRTSNQVVHLLTIPVTIEILPPIVATPSAPTGLTVNATSTSAQLSWNVPSNNGGGAISDYVVDYWAKGGSSWTRVQDGVSTSTSASVSLSANTYSFRVAAVNSAGTGTFVQSGDIQIAPVIEIYSDKFMNTSQTTITSIKKSASGTTWVYYEVRLWDPFGGRLPNSFGGQLCPASSTYPFGSWCTGATFSKTAGHSLDATYRGLFGISSGASIGQWKVTYDPTSAIRIESPRRLSVS